MAKAESYTHVRVLVTAVTSVALPYLQNMSVTQKPTSVEELFPWPSKDATETLNTFYHMLEWSLSHYHLYAWPGSQ